MNALKCLTAQLSEELHAPSAVHLCLPFGYQNKQGLFTKYQPTDFCSGTAACFTLGAKQITEIFFR
jgi:hypothetical protein